MDLGLKNKVVVITGGGSGIGLAAALEFAREGAHVAICGRAPEKLAAAAVMFEQQGFAVFTGICDVTNTQAAEEFAAAVKEALGPIDIWVNNAGSNQIKSLIDYDDEEIEKLVSINLKSFIICSNVAARNAWPRRCYPQRLFVRSRITQRRSGRLLRLQIRRTQPDPHVCRGTGSRLDMSRCVHPWANRDRDDAESR